MTYRDLPQIDALSREPALATFPAPVRVRAAREAIAEAREAIDRGEPPDVLSIAIAIAESYTRMSLRPVLNLSGVVLHTGLGRARLAKTVVAHVAQIAGSHATLEFDLLSGERGDRQTHVRDLLSELTGAEDAWVVNNAASAVLLALTALGGGDVILSRGQMVEIGGAFRMPDIIRQSGARLIEVGCTNKTRISDYEEVLGNGKASILRCHPSNYRIIGFTSEPSLRDLFELAVRHEVPLLNDQGNGALQDLREYGLPSVETLPESVSSSDLTMASGDKLLGGPQAGLLLGDADMIRKCAKHPLARAVRIDKLSLAALEATLRLHAEGRRMEIPTHRYLGRTLQEVTALAEALSDGISEAELSSGETEVGGGAYPGVGLPTCRVGFVGGQTLAQKLRLGDPPIIGRVEAGRVWLDPRTLDEEELPFAKAAVKVALA